VFGIGISAEVQIFIELISDTYPARLKYFHQPTISRYQNWYVEFEIMQDQNVLSRKRILRLRLGWSQDDGKFRDKQDEE
jgi:putative component of membrane protein insertase Oxa1/YidC/SpoIIIJ protein YidD